MKKFVMYGAGNIGRGFIGQVFYKSGYEVAFIDVNMDFVNKLNADHKYPVKIVTSDTEREEWVENVYGVNGMDINAIAEAIADAEIMATAVGVNILPRIAKPIAKSLEHRWAIGNDRPFNIIICENLIGADQYLHDLVEKELADENKSKLNNVGFVEASIGRMVPIVTPEMQEGNILKVWVEPYAELPVDSAAFKGEIPEGIVGLKPFTPFEYYIQRKLFIHNMGHAMSAYLGYGLGCEYIWQSAGRSDVQLICQRAMLESARALSKEHGVELSTVVDHVEDLLYRFKSRKLGDTVARVGRDTVRKLKSNDRLVGSFNLCKKLGIPNAYIAIGIAAALTFDEPNDAAALGVVADLKELGFEKALEKYTGIADAADAAVIKTFYDKLMNKESLESICAEAERMING